MVAFFWRGNNFLCTISIISRLIYTIPNKINKKNLLLKVKTFTNNFLLVKLVKKHIENLFKT